MTELRSMNVLIVEDDGIIAMDIEGTVEDEGHNVVGWATSADQAIAMFDKSSPDLILLDLQLSNGSSGVDVARVLRTRTGARYVFLTANGGMLDDDVEGGIGIVQKPFTHARLAEILSYLQEGIFYPPPSLALPIGLKLGSQYAGMWS